MTTIPIGRPFTMVQNVSNAVPNSRLLINVTNNLTSIEQSNDDSTWVAVTLDDDENFECASSFIRSTGVDTIINAKRV